MRRGRDASIAVALAWVCSAPLFLSADPAGAAENSSQAPPAQGIAAQAEPDDRTKMVAAARALLKDDLFEDALDRAGAAVERWPDDAGARVVKGDALYRRGDFDEAESEYRRAVALDPNCAAGHFGVGRILRTLGKYGEAAESFHTAAALDPNTPRHLRVLSNHLAKREDSIAMLHRYLDLARRYGSGESADAIRNTEAWLALLAAAGDKPISHMEKGEPTELPLRVDRNQTYIRMTVSGVKDQRFVFDTGATGVTVSPRLARKAGMSPIRPFTIAGTGASGQETGDLVLVDSIALGDGIVLRNVPATMREPAGPEEGLIGPSLFSAMAITIDMKGRTLSFDPPGGQRPGRVEPFRNVGGEILVRAKVNGIPFNAMVDSGSASTIIGRTTVSRVPEMQAAPGQWFLGTTVGVGGPLAERRVVIAGTLSLAGRVFPADGLLSGSLDGFSRAMESEVYVILGVPHLDDFIFTIDYRAMTVTFLDRAEKRAK